VTSSKELASLTLEILSWIAGEAPDSNRWHYLYAAWESLASKEVQTEMSIFPTKILLATDGSEDAELAATNALVLAQQTGSELHLVHCLALPLDTQDPSSFEPDIRRELEGVMNSGSYAVASRHGESKTVPK
jgi:hypothetical protein